MITLTPLPGRDYTTIAAARKDFHAGKDFILQDITSRWDGKPINREDLKGEHVKLVFNKGKTFTVLRYTEEM